MLKHVIKHANLRIVYRAIKVWLWLQPIQWSNLRRLTPISRIFGLDRGQCIDRYYIKWFLSAYASDIEGCVLEIGANFYTQKFGGDRVSRSDVLHAVEGNRKATIVAGLPCVHHIPSDTFNCCIICTQTLQRIYNVLAAISTLYRILKPGGVLLATFPGISQISHYDMDRWGDYWRFTTLSARQLAGIAESWIKYEVPCVRLRDYLSEPVDFLKMNIEGAEWSVLADSEDPMRQVREMIIEYHHLPGLPRTLHKILDLLHRQGFEYLINDFDDETNSGVRPPFRLTPKTRYFLLIYARRLD